MKILAFKPDHDGHVAYLKNGRLVFSIEAEKDSGQRHAAISLDHHLHCLGSVDEVPDVVAMSGWFGVPREGSGGGYFGEGADNIITRAGRFLEREVQNFCSSHERSHLLGSYGMSPFPQGQPCYALVWEGNIGAFYRIDESVKVQKIGDVLPNPGNKYAFLYALADPYFPEATAFYHTGCSGKLMALASFGRPGRPTPEEKEVLDTILSTAENFQSRHKVDFEASPFLNVGVESEAFKQLARRFQDELFDRFHRFAELHMREGLPLLVSGGCGLNCDWNSAWKQSGLFEDVFVQPCTNDSGSAIGTAVDAQHHFTGNAKIDWTVYAGEEFVMDGFDSSGLRSRPLRMEEAAAFLEAGKVLAWVQGKYEIGPRALGNRSLLARPFEKAMLDRLNRIKQREDFRPIAPICLEEDLDAHFEHHGPSPYMLYFQRVKTDRLAAVTHVDGSARLQSVNPRQNPLMHSLLTCFKKRTGYGVLCNTSLNFKGKGFINRMSDLVDYCRDNDVDGFVVNETFFEILREDSTPFLGSEHDVTADATLPGSRDSGLGQTSAVSSGPDRLSPDEVRHFHEQGYLGPFSLWNEDEAPAMRGLLEGVFLNRPDHRVHKVTRFLTCPELVDLARRPELTKRVASLLGEDLFLWRIGSFCKRPFAEESTEIPWHQDGYYWPLEPSLVCSAWLAVDDADVANGCMHVIPGSHRRWIPHVPIPDSSDSDFKKRADPSQFDPSEAVALEMKAGQFVLFNERLLHWSDHNRSARRRFAIALRILPSQVRVLNFDGEHHGLVQIHGTRSLGFNRLVEPPVI